MWKAKCLYDETSILWQTGEHDGSSCDGMRVFFFEGVGVVREAHLFLDGPVKVHKFHHEEKGKTWSRANDCLVTVVAKVKYSILKDKTVQL